MSDAARVRPTTVVAVFRLWIRHPGTLLSEWNWKSAMLSALVRGGIFFVVNLSAGTQAALAALTTEIAIRAVTAGFYGSATQAFRAVEPPWRAAVATSILFPVVAHGTELVVHSLRHTARLWPSVAASLAFTIISTQFHLFAMRRGTLIVGDGSRTLRDDLARVPVLVAQFIALPLVMLIRCVRASD
jgi:hypothetical protein